MKSSLTNNPWIINLKSSASASLRLFCFPYAGGSSQIFRPWLNRVPETIAICPIELPGRGFQLKSAPYKQMEPLVQAIAEVILPYLDQPFAFFGHSMGAVISFELARLIRRQHNLKPSHLFVSAHRAPQVPDPEPPIHNLPQAEFIEELRKLNGTPEKVLNNAELMELLIPILRADFSVLENYQYRPEATLDCPISVFGGRQDQKVQPEELSRWREQTCRSFELKMLEGDHFFINSAPSLLPELVQQLAIYID
ncbi:MAG: thioesterase II family protein [Cyanobacteria bacterium J06621_8]